MGAQARVAKLALMEMKTFTGHRRAVFAKRQDLMKWLQKHSRETQRPEVRQNCADMFKFLNSPSLLGGATLLLGSVALRSKKRVEWEAAAESPPKRRKYDSIDVIEMDSLWNAQFGLNAFYGACQMSECTKPITPLGVHVLSNGKQKYVTSSGDYLLVCKECRNEEVDLYRPVKSNRRSRLRALVWLSSHGAEALAPCAGGCSRSLYFTDRWEQGHIEADSEGGIACPQNLLPICNGCNLQQGAENMQDFVSRVRGQEKVPVTPTSRDARVAAMIYDCLIRGHDPRLLTHKTFAVS